MLTATLVCSPKRGERAWDTFLRERRDELEEETRHDPPWSTFLRIAHEWKQAGLGENEFSQRRADLEAAAAQKRRRLKASESGTAASSGDHGPLVEELD